MSDRITIQQYEALVAQLDRKLVYYMRLVSRCKRLKMPSDYPLAFAAEKAMNAVMALRNEAERLRQCELERQAEKRKRWASYSDPQPPTVA